MDHKITQELITQNSMGPNPIRLLRWNLEGVDIPAGSRILDLGSGKGLTSILLANDYQAEVIPFDKDIEPSRALGAMRACKAERVPLPIQGNARDLPFPESYFDFIIATDSYIYFGTDDLYAPYISKYLKPGGLLCFTVPGFNKDVPGDAQLPDHLRPFWADECWTWHTKEWWHSHLERTGHFKVLACDSMKDSYSFWKEETLLGPEEWRDADLGVIEKDQGEYMGFIKLVARRVNK